MLLDWAEQPKLRPWGRGRPGESEACSPAWALGEQGWLPSQSTTAPLVSTKHPLLYSCILYHNTGCIFYHVTGCILYHNMVFNFYPNTGCIPYLDTGCILYHNEGCIPYPDTCCILWYSIHDIGFSLYPDAGCNFYNTVSFHILIQDAFFIIMQFAFLILMQIAFLSL